MNSSNTPSIQQHPRERISGISSNSNEFVPSDLGFGEGKFQVGKFGEGEEKSSDWIGNSTVFSQLIRTNPKFQREDVAGSWGSSSGFSHSSSGNDFQRETRGGGKWEWGEGGAE